MSVGIDHNTAQFAVQAIGWEWQKMGTKRYPPAKVALQELAVRLRMPIHVCHFPPGTSQWNKIEHRAFCHITQNWRGRPWVSHEVIINLNANTQAGLKIRAELDRGNYPIGIKITDAELIGLNLKQANFHDD